MEYKNFKIKELKAENEPGNFTGYLAIFNNRDLGGDKILPGAFAKTLMDKGGKVPLLESHESQKRLGVLYLEEDKRGLKITRGVLNLNTSAGLTAYEDIKFFQSHDLALGLSIGYDAINPIVYTDKGQRVRDLLEIALWEGSLVTFPMNPKARVNAVKHFTESAEFAVKNILQNEIEIEDIKTLILKLEDFVALLKTRTGDALANSASQKHDEEIKKYIDEIRKMKGEKND